MIWTMKDLFFSVTDFFMVWDHMWCEATTFFFPFFPFVFLYLLLLVLHLVPHHIISLRIVKRPCLPLTLSSMDKEYSSQPFPSKRDRISLSLQLNSERKVNLVEGSHQRYSLIVSSFKFADKRPLIYTLRMGVLLGFC